MPRDVVLHGALLEGTGTQMDKPLMRFVPEVAAASQVFEAYLTPMTFLTLVRVGNGTWRVWGLGPAILSARDIFGG